MPYPRRAALAVTALAAAIGFGSYAVSGVPAPAALLGWYGDGACDDSVAQNPGSRNGCVYEAREIACDDRIDNDSDEATDALDPDCGVCVATVEDCGNSADDDCDGAVDCADADCAYSFWSPPTWRCAGSEVDCGNGADDDADGATDCRDTDCSAAPACYEPPQTEDCWNTYDDDRDGAADCQDSDCAGPQCGTPCPPGTVPGYTPSGTYNCVPAAEVCWNSVDDDDDGAVDCGDTDCVLAPECAPRTEVCGNGTDDDTDGLIDCSDGDCANDPSCGGGGCTGSYCECNPGAPECGGGGTCANPCDSPTCSGYDKCECDPDAAGCKPEICGNGADDDRDGDADCDDSECSGNCECTNNCGCTGDDCGVCDDSGACNYGEEGACEYCSCDGVDNNNDGQIDEEGETCAEGGKNGCTDPGATNYDPEAVDPDEESCEYSYGCSATIDGTTPIAGLFGGQLASAFGSFGNLLAGDPSNIAGADFMFRISLWKNKEGKWTASVSPQVALVTWDGKHPMGAIQAGPTASFNGTGLTRTPPYVTDDPIQRDIHRDIDRGKLGQWFAKFHIQLQKKCDVFNWFNRK